MSKGDIVLLPFPFTDLTGSKLRPALILTTTNVDVTVSFITTQLQWQEPTDILLSPKSTNGIKKVSIIRLSKIATIDGSLILGKIGTLSSQQIDELNLKLKQIFLIP